MTNPTEVLKHEHQVILLVLAAAEQEAQRIRESGRLAALGADRVGKMMEFFRVFADRCHHAKEENLLFERMVERGMDRDAGPIGTMLAEHDEGRRHLDGVEEGLAQATRGEADAAESVAHGLSQYAHLLRAHIEKEDTILYPMADRILSDADRKDLAKAFDRVESEEMGEEVHEKYHRLAHELAGQRPPAAE